MDSTAPATGSKHMNDRPEKDKDGTTHQDSASDQISNQSHIHKQRHLRQKLTDVQTHIQWLN